MSEFIYLCLLLTTLLVTNSLEIPTVDLSKPAEESARIFYEAATTNGFFYLINHGISQETTQRLLDYSHNLFLIDRSIKESLQHNSTHWGYVPYGDESTNPSKQSHGGTKEGFYIQHTVKPHHFSNNILSQSSQNNFINSNNNNNNRNQPKQNQWPSETLFDNNNIRFDSVISDYQEQMYLLANRLLEIVALSIDLPKDYFRGEDNNNNNMHDTNGGGLMNLLHYPKGFKSNINNGVYGTGEHTDYSLFTILLTDHHPGLQVYNENNNEWINILDNWYNNSFVINIADTLELWSNGLFKSSKHRVILDGKEDRYSVPYFVQTYYDKIIDCLPNTVNNNTECNHDPFRFGDYLMWKIKQTHETLGNEYNNNNNNNKTSVEVRGMSTNGININDMNDRVNNRREFETVNRVNRHFDNHHNEL